MATLLFTSATACNTDIQPKADSAGKQDETKEADSLEMNEHSHYELLKAYKNSHAIELMETYGAHSLGIRWKTHNGVRTDQLALAFYIDNIKDADNSKAHQSVPSSIYISQEGAEDVLIQTEVIVSLKAAPE